MPLHLMKQKSHHQNISGNLRKIQMQQNWVCYSSLDSWTILVVFFLHPQKYSHSFPWELKSRVEPGHLQEAFPVEQDIPLLSESSEQSWKICKMDDHEKDLSTIKFWTELICDFSALHLNKLRTIMTQRAQSSPADFKDKEWAQLFTGGWITDLTQRQCSSLLRT